jgi:Ca2+-binding RTX toxin-like protein
MSVRVAVVAVVAAICLSVPGGPARAAETTCAGRPVTIVASSGTTVGTPGDDVIEVDEGAVLVDAGDGDDTVCLDRTVDTVTEIDLGAGRNAVVVEWGLASEFGETAKRIVAELAYNRISVNGREFRVLGVQDAYLTARHVLVTGSSRDNRVETTGCTSDLTGGGGRDVFEAHPPSTNMLLRCAATHSTQNGGPGRDSLSGSTGDDFLTGGPGHDTAVGGNGRDRCAAEVERSCEANP